MQKFIHLRLHSEFSITDGILRIQDIAINARNDNMVAVALTDLNNMFGFVKFYTACMKAGIKPILGAELNVVSEDKLEYRIIILAKNNNGFKNLNTLITRAYTENKVFDIPYIKEDWLLTDGLDDVIILSGGLFGDIGQLIAKQRPVEAFARAQLWHAKFADNYYLELQRFIHKDTNLVLRETVTIAKELDIPVVATHPVQFAKAEDFEAHEVRVCIANGEALDNERREARFSQDQFLQTQEQMVSKFADIPSAITNTLEIAKRCNVTLTLGKYFLPDFALPAGVSIDEYLSKLAYAGLEERFLTMLSSQATAAEKDVYYARLKVELATIVEMGFSGYFLIVADFINWAKNNDVPVGPGRGSGAGSLVAFALGITDLEPLRYGLLFERFLNPERVSMPDFDIDFCQDKRELVIEYVKNKYGVQAVSQIATFGTMSSKAVIKDVGRVLGLPYGLCDSISKLILNTPAKSYGLLEALDKFADLKERIDNADDEVKRLWEMSLQLEDLTRSVGKHAAGVLIAPSQLTNFCPLYVADGMQTSQLDKDDVEQVGLVKFDFLGLRNLTIIKETLDNIKELYSQQITLSQYDFDDLATYKLLQDGNTSAVFQLESPGMRRILVKLAPDRFEDIIALLALYRPGPLGSGMVDDFINCKKGVKEPNYFHADLKPVLESTYGVIVYQEQVMQISQIVGGYTLGGADLLRRAMGKKKPEEMAKHKNIFIEGALKRGYEERLATELFDLMAKFAEYGFNKSHSAAYAVVSYHTAFLKAHYLSCFMAATLSSELYNTDKLCEFFHDCKENKITLLLPDVNLSDYRFTAVNEAQIRYGLGAIKGIGKNVVDAIVSERNNNGAFKGFVDFCTRLDKKVINKKSLEGLVKAGAFDCFDTNRAKYFNAIADVLNTSSKAIYDENQGSLFDDGSASLPTTSEYVEHLPEVEAWNLKESLQREKEAFGYYFSGSLFDHYKDIVARLNIAPLNTYSLANQEMQLLVQSRTREKEQVMVCGIINRIGSKLLKKGGKVYFINIEDNLTQFEFVIFADEYEKYKSLLKVDELVFVAGELIYDAFREQLKVTAKQVHSLDEILLNKVQAITLQLTAETDIDVVKPLVSVNGSANIFVNYANDIASCRLQFGNEYKFIVNYTNLNNLSILVGQDNWMITQYE